MKLILICISYEFENVYNLDLFRTPIKIFKISNLFTLKLFSTLNLIFARNFLYAHQIFMLLSLNDTAITSKFKVISPRTKMKRTF